MNARRKKLNMTGLTLVELLVSIGILAIIAVLGWRGIDSILQARISLSYQLEKTRGIQLTLAQMESDSKHFVTRTTFEHARIAGDKANLILIRTVSRENMPSLFQVVAYRIKKSVLSRSESIAIRTPSELEAIWRSTLDGAASAENVVLLKGVNKLSIRLWEDRTEPDIPGLKSGPWREISRELDAERNDTGLEVEILMQASDKSIVKTMLLGVF